MGTGMLVQSDRGCPTRRNLRDDDLHTKPLSGSISAIMTSPPLYMVRLGPARDRLTPRL
jgi:hypothetical protein